jgi:hypothetical protein
MIIVSRLLHALLSVAILTTLSATNNLSPQNAAVYASGASVASMLQTLNEAGIEFSDETGLLIELYMQEMRSKIADLGMDTSQYISYPVILSILGTGRYDTALQSFSPFTNSAYAFDAECYDIVKAYEDFLLSVSRISNGAILIEEYYSDVDEATFKYGIGIQKVFFKLNGQLYCFSAKFFYDWMDCSIIDYVNQILAEQGIDKRLWCMFDGGQGFVVFYNTAEWACRFTELTHCPLALKASEAL